MISRTRTIVSLILILTTFIFATIIWNEAFASNELSLVDKVINHPDAIEVGRGSGWYRVVIKENLSDTEYDWRFDRRMIETMGGNIFIGHRMEQNSGGVPNSNWVIVYSFTDYLGDGTLNVFNQDRFISIEQGDIWLRISPYWPDKFRYPLLTEAEVEAQFKKELEYWNKKL